MKNDVREMQEFADEELDFARRELKLEQGPQWVEHRFSFPDHIKADSKEERSLVLKLAPLLRSRGLEIDVINGLWVVAWENARLSKSWSDRIVEIMCGIADRAGFEYEGWNWDAAGKPTFLRKTLDGAKAVAFGLVVLIAIQFTFDGRWDLWIRGSPQDIAVRIGVSLLGLAAASILIAGVADWWERRKYR